MEKYEEFKNNSDVLLLDYDDLLIYANKALDDDSELLKYYQNSYDYVLTDESQDTSLVQHYIIEKWYRNTEIYVLSRMMIKLFTVGAGSNRLT